MVLLEFSGLFYCSIIKVLYFAVSHRLSFNSLTYSVLFVKYFFYFFQLLFFSKSRNGEGGI